MNHDSDGSVYEEPRAGLEKLRAILSGVLDSRAEILAALSLRPDGVSSDEAVTGIALALYRDQAERSRMKESGRLTASERRDHLAMLANALATARRLLDATEASPVLTADLGWQDDRDMVPVPRLYLDTVTPLAKVEEMAKAAAARIPVRRGPLGGDRIVSNDLVQAFAALYQDATGKKAGLPGNLDTNGGPFFRFVSAVLSAVGGYDAKPETLRSAIRDALSDKKAEARRKASAERRRKIPVVH